jgi:hypothetical protein
VVAAALKAVLAGEWMARACTGRFPFKGVSQAGVHGAGASWGAWQGKVCWVIGLVIKRKVVSSLCQKIPLQFLSTFLFISLTKHVFQKKFFLLHQLNSFTVFF